MAADKKFGLMVEMKSDIKKFQTGMGKAQSGVKKMVSSLKTMAVAMLAAFSIKAIGGFIKSTLRLFNIQAKSESLLLTALKGRQDIQGRLIQQASKLQKITLFGDEETIAAQAMLASMNLNEKAIKRLTPLVQDLATAKKMDLRAAADLVAKSVGSSTNAMSRYGIEITGAVGSSERLNTACENLSKAFKGQAEAAAKAGTGGITQFKNALGDVKEMLGALVLKGIMPLINFGNRLVANIGKQSKEILKQQTRLNSLVGAATNATISEEARLQVIRDIQTEYPDFLANIDAEKVSNEQLTEALKETNLQMVERIRLAILQEALSKEEGKLTRIVARQMLLVAELNEKQKELADTTRESIIRTTTFGSTLYTVADQNKVLRGEIEQLEKAIGRNKKNQATWTSAWEETNEAIREQMVLMDQMGIAVDGAAAPAGKPPERPPPLAKIAGISYGPPKEEIEKSAKTHSELIAEVEGRETEHQAKMLRIYEAHQKEKTRLKAKEQAEDEARRDNQLAIAQEITHVVGAGIVGIANIQEVAKQRELKAAGDNAKKREVIEKKYARKRKATAISEAIIGTALAVINALQTKPFIPMGLIAAVGAGIAGGLQIAAIAATSLAKGGIAFGKTLVRVGEYPGARSNPEVIAPLNKLQGMLGIGGEVVFRQHGVELVGVLKAYDERNKLMA
ncbi:hypothetical protein ES705_19418 [subsurface metagenome]